MAVTVSPPPTIPRPAAYGTDHGLSFPLIRPLTARALIPPSRRDHRFVCLLRGPHAITTHWRDRRQSTSSSDCVRAVQHGPTAPAPLRGRSTTTTTAWCRHQHATSALRCWWQLRAHAIPRFRSTSRRTSTINFHIGRERSLATAATVARLWRVLGHVTQRNTNWTSDSSPKPFTFHSKRHGVSCPWSILALS
jgi:hypothetical protein